MNKYLAEAFGTFWLVLGGCGSAVLAAGFPDVGIGLLGVALPSTMSTSTISPNSIWESIKAVDAPTFPAPITEIFGLPI